MVIEITKQNIQTCKENSNLLIIDFYAIWCGPCMTFKDTFDSVSNLFSEKEKIIFGKINVDEQRDLAIEYKVASIPMIVIIKNNIPCWTHTGTMSEIALKEKIDLLLK
jgi:thioredoxin 1